MPLPLPASPRMPAPPLPATPLVGRQGALAALVALLHGGGVRLATLLGPGGVGKTRLALAAVDKPEVRAAFPHGIAFIPLAAIADASLVELSLAAALGVRERSERDLHDALTTALCDRRMLLVLDNFEHLLPAAPVVAALLAACPGLTVLTTSRAALRLAGEQRVPVPPLSLPADAQTAELARLEESDAVRLFRARAAALDPAFALTAENAPAVAEICRRLDGLPLAIELAAAWVSTLAPASLLRRLDPRLPFLTRGAVDHPDRHRTMRAAVGWSYDLLSPREQTCFRSLAVCTGGFTLDAAEALASGDVLSALASLVEKSLVVPFAQDADGGVPRADGPSRNARYQEPRFAMLETIREFGLEQLRAAGEDAELSRRHTEVFLSLVEAAAPALLAGADVAGALARLDADEANIRVALDRVLAAGDAVTALRFVTVLGWYWHLRGRYLEGRARLERTLAFNGDAPLDLRARALEYLRLLCFSLGDDAAAAAALAEETALWAQLGDAAGLARAGFFVGLLDLRRDEDEAAMARFAATVPLAQQIGNLALAVTALVTHADVLYRRGDLDGSARLAEQALALEEDAGLPYGRRNARVAVAQVAAERGDQRRAAALLGEALTIHAEAGYELGLAYCFAVLARLAGLSRLPERAARLLGAAEAIGERTPATTSLHDDVRRRALVVARAALGEPAFAAHAAAGGALAVEEAVAEALDLAAAIAAAPEAAREPAGALTDRERDVLRLLAAGCSNPEIGAALFISPTTARNHVNHILAKLGVDSRAAAAAVAVRQGLV